MRRIIRRAVSVSAFPTFFCRYLFCVLPFSFHRFASPLCPTYSTFSTFFYFSISRKKGRAETLDFIILFLKFLYILPILPFYIKAHLIRDLIHIHYLIIESYHAYAHTHAHTHMYVTRKKKVEPVEPP